MITQEQITAANKTARPWKTTKVQQKVADFLRMIQVENVLDFGAGPQALPKKALEKEFPHVFFTAYDFGDNLTEEHDEFALDGKYDLVYASNVLNVQSDGYMLHKTIEQMTGAIYKDGWLIVNYPDSPRKMPYLTMELMIDAIMSHGLELVESTNGVMIFQRIYLDNSPNN